MMCSVQGRLKRAKEMKSKVKSLLIIFIHIKEIVHEELFLAGQTVNSAYYCDVLRRLRETVRTLYPELRRQKSWLLHHDNAPSHTFIFTTDFLTKRQNVTVVPHTPYFSLFPRLKIKLKGSHFDTIGVIEAESRTVLSPSHNTASRMNLKVQKLKELCIPVEWDYLEGDGG
jgi:hypothetical protein